MAARPLIDLEAINLRRADEMMANTALLKEEIAIPSDRGELHHSAKIDREQADEIRERTRPWTDSKGVVHAGEAIRAIAREYGIDPKTVRKIRDGQIWRSTGNEPVSPVSEVEEEVEA